MPTLLLCHTQLTLLTSQRHRHRYNLVPWPSSKAHPQRLRKGKQNHNKLMKRVNVSLPRLAEGLNIDAIIVATLYTLY